MMSVAAQLQVKQQALWGATTETDNSNAMITLVQTLGSRRMHHDQERTNVGMVGVNLMSKPRCCLQPLAEARLLCCATALVRGPCDWSLGLRR